MIAEALIVSQMARELPFENLAAQDDASRRSARLAHYRMEIRRDLKRQSFTSDFGRQMVLEYLPRILRIVLVPFKLVME